LITDRTAGKHLAALDEQILRVGASSHAES
jgi:hypothetical protein